VLIDRRTKRQILRAFKLARHRFKHAWWCKCDRLGWRRRGRKPADWE